MTTARRDGQGTPFGQWVREQRALESVSNDLSVCDSDMWFHKYKFRAEKNGVGEPIDHIMLVEVKCFDARQSFAQSDTLAVVDGLIRKASMRQERRRPVTIKDHRTGGKRQVRPFGVHFLQMSNDRPDNSESIKWDGKEI